MQVITNKNLINIYVFVTAYEEAQVQMFKTAADTQHFTTLLSMDTGQNILFQVSDIIKKNTHTITLDCHFNQNVKNYGLLCIL